MVVAASVGELSESTSGSLREKGSLRRELDFTAPPKTLQICNPVDTCPQREGNENRA
jgi:hypothetical protein